MKVACTVWSGGKARDDIRGLPITIKLRLCADVKSGAGRPGYPCETVRHFPAANEIRYPHRSGRGAYLLWECGAAFCRPLPERYRALPGNDDEAGGSERDMKTNIIINRDALFALKELPAESVHCAVTSPPYYALRAYGLDAQLGREETTEQYI